MDELRTGLNKTQVENSTVIVSGTSLSNSTELISGDRLESPTDYSNQSLNSTEALNKSLDSNQRANTVVNINADSVRLEADLEALRPKSKSDLTELALAHKAGMLAGPFRGRIPSAIELRNITEELGVELATAVYIRTLHDSNFHGPFIRSVRAFDFKGWDQASARAAKIEVVVIASNSFEAGRPWGEHVDEWRSWARDLGFTTDVIETDQRRSVAANARVIFEYLARRPNRERIIVSYGQGSAEFRYLLHRRVNRDPKEPIPEEIEQVRAWMSVCGAGAGSSASTYCQDHRIRRLLARLRMKVAGRNPITLAETSTNFPLWRIPIPTPPKFAIASVVAVPYRQHIPPAMLGLFNELSKSSPNDGVVGVAEASLPSGWIIPVLGMNHRADGLILEPVFKRTLAALVESVGLIQINN